MCDWGAKANLNLVEVMFKFYFNVHIDFNVQFSIINNFGEVHMD